MKKYIFCISIFILYNSYPLSRSLYYTITFAIISALFLINEWRVINMHKNTQKNIKENNFTLDLSQIDKINNNQNKINKMQTENVFTKINNFLEKMYLFLTLQLNKDNLKGQITPESIIYSFYCLLNKKQITEDIVKNNKINEEILKQQKAQEKIEQINFAEKNFNYSTEIILKNGINISVGGEEKNIKNFIFVSIPSNNIKNQNELEQNNQNNILSFFITLKNKTNKSIYIDLNQFTKNVVKKIINIFSVNISHFSESFENYETDAFIADPPKKKSGKGSTYEITLKFGQYIKKNNSFTLNKNNNLGITEIFREKGLYEDCLLSYFNPKDTELKTSQEISFQINPDVNCLIN
jgi:hypothetical protein